MNDPISLSRKDRVLFSYLLRILEKLYPEESDVYAQYRSAIEKGYAVHYEDMAEHLHEEMATEECQEVIKILAMFRAIRSSYDQLDDKSGIEEKEIEFPGFDGNNEPKQMLYTEYLIHELGHFKELQKEGKDYSAHMEMLSFYRPMLENWKRYKTKERIKLDKDQIKKLLEIGRLT